MGFTLLGVGGLAGNRLFISHLRVSSRPLSCLPESTDVMTPERRSPRYVLECQPRV